MTDVGSTEAMIAKLAAQAGRPAPALARLRAGVAAAWAAALALAALATAAALGLRPDLPGALTAPQVAFKFVWAAGLALSAGLMLARAGEPGRRVLTPATVTPAMAAMAAGLALWAADPVPTPDYASPASCLTAILLLALPGVGAGLLALRAGAPVRPGWAGAAAGMLAGAGAAAGYALYCPVDQAAFVLVWYGLGVAAAAGIGALAGRRAAAW